MLLYRSTYDQLVVGAVYSVRRSVRQRRAEYARVTDVTDGVATVEVLDADFNVLKTVAEFGTTAVWTLNLDDLDPAGDD